MFCTKSFCRTNFCNPYSGPVTLCNQKGSFQQPRITIVKFGQNHILLKNFRENVFINDVDAQGQCRQQTTDQPQ